MADLPILTLRLLPLQLRPRVIDVSVLRAGVIITVLVGIIVVLLTVCLSLGLPLLPMLLPISLMSNGVS